MAVPHRPSKAIRNSPSRFNCQWATTPEWLTSVTVNQLVNHVTTSTDGAEEIQQLIDAQTRRLKPH